VPLALVTGTRQHLGAAAAALGRAGFDVVTWEVADPPPPAAAVNRRSFPGIRRKSNAGTGPDGPFDCYVQLPCGAMPAGTGARPAVVGRRAADDLVCRMDMLAAVAAALRPAASVILAVGETRLPAEAGPDAPASDLLAAVALALLEDLGRPTARVAVLPVAELCRPPAEMALAAAQWEMPTPPLVSAP